MLLLQVAFALVEGLSQSIAEPRLGPSLVVALLSPVYTPELDVAWPYDPGILDELAGGEVVGESVVVLVASSVVLRKKQCCNAICGLIRTFGSYSNICSIKSRNFM